MSMTVILYIPSPPLGEVWMCDAKFELDSWCHCLADFVKAQRPCECPVRAAWISEKSETRDPQVLRDCDIMWVTAADAKKIKLFEEESHPTRQAAGRLATSTIAGLPDDWPVVFYYV
jgi:hypothetical protein